MRATHRGTHTGKTGTDDGDQVVGAFLAHNLPSRSRLPPPVKLILQLQTGHRDALDLNELINAVF